MLKKRFYFYETLWLINLFAYTGLLLYIILSSKVEILFHPRQYIFLIITVLFFFFLIYLQFYNIYSFKTERKINKSIVIFYMPILFAIIGLANDKDSIINTVYRQNTFIPVNIQILCNDKDKEAISETDSVIMNKDNYYQEYNKIYDDIGKYIGREIQINGYVYRESVYKDNQFVLAQDLMWCCAADIAVIGFFCEYDNASEFETGSWYELSGKIAKSLYPDQETGKEREFPSIHIDKYRKINPPDIPCLFPY